MRTHGPAHKKKIEEETGLNSQDVQRGFACLSATWEQGGGEQDDVFLWRRDGRESLYQAGPKLGAVLEILARTVEKTQEENAEISTL